MEASSNYLSIKLLKSNVLEFQVYARQIYVDNTVV